MGLLVPVVHDADIKDLVQISIESRQVIERARSGRVNEGDLTGATFSISNLGMYGVDEFTAIINPPEAAILAVGAIKDVPVVEDARIGGTNSHHPRRRQAGARRMGLRSCGEVTRRLRSQTRRAARRIRTAAPR